MNYDLDDPRWIDSEIVDHAAGLTFEDAKELISELDKFHLSGKHRRSKCVSLLKGKHMQGVPDHSVVLYICLQLRLRETLDDQQNEHNIKSKILK
jgi:hypothetical protein